MPVGVSRKAGTPNSVSPWMKDRMKLAITAGVTSGMVMLSMVRSVPDPSVAAASSSSTAISSSALDTMVKL